MRLIDKSSKRIPFFNKNYFELNVDELQNKKSQFFLIKKSKGFWDIFWPYFHRLI